MRTVKRSDRTPNMNVIFSRVRMIFADCQEAASEVMRCETYETAREETYGNKDAFETYL